MYKVEGFLFETKEQALTAQKEAEGIKYIKNQTHMDDPDTVLKLYNRLILKEVFTTPVGFAFLGELRDFLNTVPYIRAEEISPIPVLNPGMSAEQIGERSTGGSREYEKRRAQAERDLRANRKETIRRNRMNERERERAARLEHQAIKYAGKNYRKQFLISTFFAVVFAVALLGMFVINAISSNSVTILNYENALLDKYSVWEQELSEREAAVLEREKALEQQE